MSMLTLKHREKSGRENIQMAHSVSLTPNGPDGTGGKLEAYGCTGIGGAVDVHGYCQYADGKVYVMNDAGSTVAKYDFG